MPTILIRFSDLKRRGVVGSWAQLRRLIDLHGFPPGRLLGVNTRVWSELEVDDWLEKRPTTSRRGAQQSISERPAPNVAVL